jgi:crotonobetainyl-CoA:carnitine CoA-transferase CaiB-like acyl-CoA transferase
MDTRALLQGVRILDLTKATSGPFATQLLADLGAEVIKIEEPAGSSLGRSILEPDRLIAGMDPYFLSVNRGKKSVVLPLSEPLGLETFYGLVRRADVVVSNYRPGVDTKLKIDHESLAAANERIITCSLSGFGRTGPLSQRASFDITILAECGMMAYISKRDGEGRLAYPIVSIADLLGGMYVAVAVPAALERRRRTGTGCAIDIGMHDAVLSWFIGYGVSLLNFDEASHYYEGALWGAFDTATDPLVITAHRDAQWRNLCRAIGQQVWLSDERFAEPLARKSNIQTLRLLVTENLQKKPAHEWAEIFERERVPFAEIKTAREALDSAQTATRKMLVDVAFPTGESARLIGNPIKVSDVEQTYTPPPVHGQDTEAVLREVLGLEGDRLTSVLGLASAPRGNR